jgi:Fe2+ transport system protein FeoA
MKLSDTKSGDTVRVIGFDEGCEEFKCKLEALGLRRGDVINVIQKGFFGPVTVESNGAKIALCGGQAKKIVVEKI